jgi:hypothetical protein
VERAVEEFLHIAAVVKACERIANGFQTERFSQAEVGNRECEVFRDRGGELAPPGKRVRVSIHVGARGSGIVVLYRKGSEGVAVGNEGYADGRAFAKQVRTTRLGCSTGMSMGASAA